MQARLERDSLQQRIDSLAVVIYEYKSLKSQGYFEKRKLQNYLRESIQLSDQLQDVQLKTNHLDERISKLSDRLLLRYDRQIDSLMQHPSHEAEWVQEISELQQKRQQLQKWLEPDQPVQSVYDIEILETDTPEEIDLKVSFYRDQAQRLVEQAGQMNEQIDRIRQENRIRQRMSDLVDDVTLFAQNDESIVVENPPERVTTEYAGPIGNPDDSFRESDENKIFDQSLNAEPARTPDIQNMAPQELDRYIRILENQEQRYSRLADSLRQMADKYEKEAEKLRNSLKPY
ncbi:hypothetical protein GF406_15445 [candidate division KSB1 bacterium]|nr:hypothetical protein [candidate division KSB1 bacterium]